MNPSQMFHAVFNISVWHPHQTCIGMINNIKLSTSHVYGYKCFQAEKNLSFFFLCNCQCIGHGVSKLRNDPNLENYETV